jgi:hypothetical protein
LELCKPRIFLFCFDSSCYAFQAMNIISFLDTAPNSSGRIVISQQPEMGTLDTLGRKEVFFDTPGSTAINLGFVCSYQLFASIPSHVDTHE